MKKLAIIGASYLQLPLVKKAKAMGIETHCFAWDEGAVCREVADFFYPISILDKEAILLECEKIQIDGITTIATDMAMPSISHVAERLNLTGNSYETALNTTDKWRMRNVFFQSGCAIPNFRVTDKPENNQLNFDFPVIVKPIDRSGSRGVKKVNSQNELSEAIAVALEESISNRAIIENFIEGREVSVESISWKGEHYILAITDKVTTGAPHFVELAHHQPSLLSSEIQEKIITETLKALTSLNVEYGAGHTEIKIDENGEVYIIEVGARMGGDFIGSDLVELSTGYDFIQGVIEIALGNFSVPVLRQKNSSGVYFLCKETAPLLSYFETNNEFDVEKKIQNKNLKYISNSNDRSGYLIYQSIKRQELL
ncbi:hypothetical protein FEDK69T_30590 [Flavobacterium enshiense DK69]|uniref:ATP-grasp domain-containing protein n=1 Tax=Flavobacterium enshiense DK69 TaxID=1107311 RepID=V6S079_9FLAO|nr:ATP-grasp domain-containing protein [Flavobacterium enshiense]ESU19804.1 hypothetical protein FEDK69T_30590 [Flavobacterium enshiense DK69]KGO93103.1 hypothetical protein Q767_15080 [Flavobacterium enshiense DK69]